MHLPLLKALVAVVSAAVLATGVALAPAAGAHRPHSPRPASQMTSLEADGLRLLGQLATGNVKPDPGLEDSWMGDVTTAARSLGLSDSALAAQLRAGASLAQIAASRGVPIGTPTAVLLHHVRDDLDRAERDQAVSPAAATVLLDALSTALGKS